MDHEDYNYMRRLLLQEFLAKGWHALDQGVLRDTSGMEDIVFAARRAYSGQP